MELQVPYSSWADRLDQADLPSQNMDYPPKLPAYCDFQSEFVP